MSATNKTVNVEIYADIICPWCYIGKKRLDAAFAARRHVTPRYIWRGFLLNPGMPAEGMDRQAYLHNKFGSAAAAVYGRIAAAGLDSGITFNFDKITRTPDSRSVHHVLLSAQNNVEILSEAFYQAYFIESKDIGDPDIIAAIIDEAGVDIDLDTVDFNLNFDDSIQEPQVLPTRLPTLLINGASGIAVGMATSMPPHNLSEICEAINYVINNPTCTSDELLQIVPGPDFPTAGIIKGRSGIVDTYTTGRGRIVMEAATDIEETRNGRQRIIVTELPYQVNKSSLVEKIAQLVRDKRIQGISDIRDESDRKGMRIVIELRRDAQPNITLNNLYRHTQLRDSFNSNMLALVNGQPQVLPLKRMIELFIQHRQQIIRRRSEFLLQKAKDRDCLLYTSPSPRDRTRSRMPSSA